MLPSQRVINTLGYAGLIPFVVPALLIVFGSSHSEFLMSLAGAYAFGIICFLTGSWWGMGLLPGARSALLLSNLFFLIAFFTFALAIEVWGLVAAGLLVSIYLAEQHSSLFPDFPASYRTIRTVLTLIASCSMLTIYWAG